MESFSNENKKRASGKIGKEPVICWTNQEIMLYRARRKSSPVQSIVRGACRNPPQRHVFFYTRHTHISPFSKHRKTDGSLIFEPIYIYFFSTYSSIWFFFVVELSHSTTRKLIETCTPTETTSNLLLFCPHTHTAKKSRSKKSQSRGKREKEEDEKKKARRRVFFRKYIYGLLKIIGSIVLCPLTQCIVSPFSPSEFFYATWGSSAKCVSND